MKDVVVLVSGGLDSTVLVTKAEREGRLLGLVFVDYNQPAMQQEAWRAFALASKLRVQLRAVHVYGLDLQTMAAADTNQDRVGLRVVPGRNLALLALAGNLASVWGADEVWIGCIAEDGSYLDCRPEALAAADVALRMMTGVGVRAPFVGMTKAQVGAMLDPDHSVWSCYEGGYEPCGICSSCIARARSMLAVEK